MQKKYGINTYPEYLQMENSDTDKDNFQSTAFRIQKSYGDAKDVSEPHECIFTQQKNNISFFLSDQRNTFKNRKFKSLTRKPYNLNYDSDVINRKHSLNLVEEKFSYNYTIASGANKKKNLNSNASSSQRINLNHYLMQKSSQFPKRTIKSSKNQFYVEKSDNFNVLSYRPEEYHTDYMKTDSKSKIIKIFKKQCVDELFYPSKRTQSPPSQVSSHNSSGKKGHLNT